MSSNRSTPEPALGEDSGQSSSSGLLSESEDERDSLPTRGHEPNRERDRCDKALILHRMIVERYEGGKCGEVYHGEGVAYFQGGHIYKGSFSHGLMHGRGEYIWSDGVKFQGDFKLNVPTGRGTYTWIDGSTYEGDVQQGVRHGVGTHKCAKTSTVYRGQWNLGKRHGQGVLYYNQTATSWYEGEWVNNCREGWGKRCYPSGNVYEGQWRNNVRHGRGTMRWVQLEQQYTGQWVNGVQEGEGTHTWFRKRVARSQYPRMNEYRGEFVQGLRHGQGQFSYASGAVYCGDWRHDKKHGQGRYTFENGHVYEGEFDKDCMAEFPAFTPGLSGITTPFPDENDSSKDASRSSSNSSPLGSDMVLNIQSLLNGVPEACREQELQQVEFAVLRHIGLLRDIYSFYSSLGHGQDKTFPLSRLQFSRFLTDCNVHQRRVTLAQIHRFLNGEVCSPFTDILPRECVSHLITVAYHIYHRDAETSKNILSACFSKLMRQNIVPNAKNVRGHLFCHPVRAAVAMTHSDRCWEVYQALCKTNSVQCVPTFTVRQFVFMLKDLCLYDRELTVSRVLKILSVDNPAIYDGIYSNLDLEMCFLEFFEALLGCAEVKGQKIQTGVETERSVQDDTGQNITPASSRQSMSEETEQRQSPTLAFTDPDLNDWMQKTHQFFNQNFFPAYEHSVKLKIERETHTSPADDDKARAAGAGR